MVPIGLRGTALLLVLLAACCAIPPSQAARLPAEQGYARRSLSSYSLPGDFEASSSDDEGAELLEAAKKVQSSIEKMTQVTKAQPMADPGPSEDGNSSSSSNMTWAVEEGAEGTMAHNSTNSTNSTTSGGNATAWVTGPAAPGSSSNSSSSSKTMGGRRRLRHAGSPHKSGPKAAYKDGPKKGADHHDSHVGLLDMAVNMTGNMDMNMTGNVTGNITWPMEDDVNMTSYNSSSSNSSSSNSSSSSRRRALMVVAGQGWNSTYGTNSSNTTNSTGNATASDLLTYEALTPVGNETQALNDTMTVESAEGPMDEGEDAGTETGELRPAPCPDCSVISYVACAIVGKSCDCNDCV